MFSSVIWCQMPRNKVALGRTTPSPAAGFHTGSDLNSNLVGSAGSRIYISIVPMRGT
jgi:hypothetical protein